MEEDKKRNWWKIGCLGFLGFFVLTMIIGAIAGPVDEGEGGQIVAASSEVDGVEVAAEPEAPSNKPGISAEEFAQLRAGMSYSEVVSIIGSEGELMSENEMAGYRTQMYMWEGEGTFGVGNANALFQNGEMVQKSQFGLD